MLSRTEAMIQDLYLEIDDLQKESERTSERYQALEEASRKVDKVLSKLEKAELEKAELAEE